MFITYCLLSNSTKFAIFKYSINTVSIPSLLFHHFFALNSVYGLGQHNKQISFGDFLKVFLKIIYALRMCGADETRSKVSMLGLSDRYSLTMSASCF